MKHPPTIDLSPYFQTIDELMLTKKHINWSEFFGNDHPVQIDVGCGRGLFLYNSGIRNPDINYLGVELEYKEARRGARRIQKLELPNVRILGGSVFDLLTKLVPPHSVDAIHIYFPDPWWKRKHRRRRVFNEIFANLSSRALIPEGLLHSWTDVEEYFGVISALMDHHADFTKLDTPEERAPEHDMDYQTSYERKKRKLGMPIYRAKWQRQPLPEAQLSVE